LKGLLGFPPGGYEISGLKRRNVLQSGDRDPDNASFCEGCGKIVASLALKEWSRHSRRVI